MIVRNGGATLSACLESVAPLVDEMVVVDTGSSDDTVDLARAHGARVLFSATSQPLVTSIQQAHPGYPGGTYKIVKGTADAIIL